MSANPDDLPGPDPGPTDAGAAVKPPEEWVTGDEPATAAQLSYLQTLSRDVGEPVPDGLSKAQASELIDGLRERSPRVDPDAAPSTPAQSTPAQEPPARQSAQQPPARQQSGEQQSGEQPPVDDPPAQEPPD